MNPGSWIRKDEGVSFWGGKVDGARMMPVAYKPISKLAAQSGGCHDPGNFFEYYCSVSGQFCGARNAVGGGFGCYAVVNGYIYCAPDDPEYLCTGGQQGRVYRFNEYCECGIE